MEHYATAQQVWVAALVFMRVGALIMMLPGIGETYVPVRIRLSFALALAFCLMPIAAPSLPLLPATIASMVGYILKELAIGLMIGALLRMFLASLSTAGELVSLQTTLSFAQTTNPTQAQPTTTLSTFLMLLGLTLIFDTDLHRLFIAAIAHSYTLFPPAKVLPLNDAGELAAETMGKTFALGVQLAAPVIVFALVFHTATGLVGRMMPQFQIFFVATPLTLLMGLSIFALSIGSIGLVWMQHYESFLHVFA
jgi:flagellar biosynthetic protein FliR